MTRHAAPALLFAACLLVSCAAPKDTPPGQAGKRVVEVAPVYPAVAKAAGVSGDVVLHTIINNDGTVRELTPISGPPLLIPAAIDAVKQWRYEPYVKDGVPRAVDTSVTVHFDLSRPSTSAP